MDKDKTEKITATVTKGKRWGRRARLFLLGLFVLLCLIVIPAIIIPPWLASKGIEINAVSGISFDKGLVIDEVAIAINNNAITFNKLSLEYFEDKESAISDASWRLFSRQSKVKLAPYVINLLRQAGIKLGDLTLTNTAFNFTDLSAPYVFSAHTSQIEASLFDQQGNAVRQAANDIDLVLTTDPFLVITGFIKHSDLSLLVPGDLASNRYPVSFDNGNFSISWQPDIIPLSVHIESLTPQWPTVSEGYAQSGRNIALELDLNHAADTIRLSADRLWLDQPGQLPEFVKKPDSTHQGLHLGQAIANLSLLPLHQLSIQDFSYGELIINSVLQLETPQQHLEERHLEEKAIQTKLRLTGKALGPEPYDIDVQLEHLNERDAVFSGQISGPKGNSLQCRASLLFVNPLPESLRCMANFSNTRELTDRLKLYDIPNAVLGQPLVITASRTAIEQESKAAGPASASSRKDLSDITLARYDINIELPERIELALNRFAFSHPVLSPAKEPPVTVKSLAFNTDGILALSALYQNDRLTIELTEPAEQITMKSMQYDSSLSLLIKQLHCAVRLDTFTAPDRLQCHSQSSLQGTIKQLFPATDTELNGVSVSSDIDLSWTGRQLSVQLQQNELTIDTALFALHPDLLHTQVQELQLKAANISLLQTTDANSTPEKALQLSSSEEVSFKGQFYGERLIDDLTEQQRQQQGRDKSQLPVQKYDGKLSLVLTKTALTHAGKQFKLDSEYQTTVSLKQNDQHLPRISSKGTIHFAPNTLTLSGTLNNIKQAQLMRFTVVSDFMRQNTHIKLHRNKVAFSPKQTLQKYYLPRLPIDYDLNNGAISYDADLTLKKDKLTGEFGIFTENLSGNIHGFYFADLNVSFTAAVTPKSISTKYPVSLDIGLLHAGVLLENIYALIEFDTEASRYVLHRASAYALGGSISTHAVTGNNLSNISDIPVLVHRLDLEKLMQAINSEDIEMTGLLDGSLPMSIEDGLPVIKNGKLRSRHPGGILKYKEGSAIDQNVEAAGERSMLVVGRILKNYKYDSLSIDIDYSKEGQLKASSRFKGRNPDFQEGRPVYVNLNIEDNIPALIKTLNVINSSKLESLFLKQLGLDE